MCQLEPHFSFSLHVVYVLQMHPHRYLFVLRDPFSQGFLHSRTERLLCFACAITGAPTLRQRSLRRGAKINWGEFCITWLNRCQCHTDTGSGACRASHQLAGSFLSSWTSWTSRIRSRTPDRCVATASTWTLWSRSSLIFFIFALDLLRNLWDVANLNYWLGRVGVEESQLWVLQYSISGRCSFSFVGVAV